MLYSKDFYTDPSSNTKNRIHLSSKIFSVILETPVNEEKGYSRYSIINAVKPLSYFASIFGNQIVRYKNNDIHKIKVYGKIYSLIIIAAIILAQTFVNPKSWKDTKADIPLNILTKCFGYLMILEVTYHIFISAFGNSERYYKLLRKLDEIDQHFMTSRILFIKRRMVIICLIIFTMIQVSFTFWLRKFSIQNLSVHFLVYLFMLQGALTFFWLENIYSKLLVFNDLLLDKISNNLTRRKTYIYKKSVWDELIMKVFADSRILEQKLCSHSSWFELMEMYDKTADCVYLFNQIYAGQVFFMFQSGLFCTMLTTCRYLSPSLKNSDVILSDLYLFSSISIRPFYVSKMCEMLTTQKNKTLSMLLDILVYGDLDLLKILRNRIKTDKEDFMDIPTSTVKGQATPDVSAAHDVYYDQIQTMINLVGIRKIELSTNVVTADLKTVLNFFGRVISYTVLMIQYFYMHVFSE